MPRMNKGEREDPAKLLRGRPTSPKVQELMPKLDVSALAEPSRAAT
jgi:hypothetical protein